MGSTVGNERTARVFAGLLILPALVALALLSAPSAPAIDGARSARAGHGHATAVPLNRLEGFARKRFPKTFAGLWQARGKVFVAFTAKAKRRTGRLRALAAKPGRLRTVKFERSLVQLESTQERMIADRESRPPSTVGFPDYDLDLDITKNAPVVTFENVNPAMVSALRDLYGQALIVRQGPLGEPEACSRSSCGPYLRSGLRTVGPDNDADAGLFQCSTAFAVHQRSLAYKGILSAGHCGGIGVDDKGDPRYHGSGSPPPKYGVVARSRFVFRTDAEVHKITVSPFTRKPWIFDSEGLKARPVQRVSDWNWVRPGMGMCKAGITTGKTCGKVKSRYYSPGSIPGSERFIKTSYCAEGGDSGAGVYLPLKLGNGETKVTAYGVHSGGPKGYECNTDNSIKPGDYSFFGHVQYAQTELGVRVQVTK